jgi:AmiR/NasT family two-component response regulator
MNGRRQRVLIANEEAERAEALRQLLGEFGALAEVVAGDVLETCAAIEPDLLLLGRRASRDATLALLGRLAHESGVAVIVVLSEADPDYVREAARAGAYGFVVGLRPDVLRSAMDVALERHGDYRGLQLAFVRRGAVERAKGVLMATLAIDDETAFELMRRHARATSRKLVDVADDVADGSLVLEPLGA